MTQEWHRTIAIVALLVAVSTTSSKSQARSAIERPNALAFGLGLDSGLVGLKYQRMLGEDGNFAAGMGIGPTLLLTPSLQWNALTLGNWHFHLTAVAAFSPRGGIIFSKNSLVSAIAPGIQRWAFRGNGVSLWLNAALAVARQFTGDAEGGRDPYFISPRLQLGIAY